MIDSIFNSKAGETVFQNALLAILDYEMEQRIKAGVIVGFSGGPDSVMLLMLLQKLRRDYYDFPILAVHINHLIRGGEAQRDEDFSVEFCRRAEVNLIVKRIDVPSIAAEKRRGIEEAAREVRYAAFADVIAEHPSFSTVAVAHNATDNLETALLNILRGAGINGVAGISPVRDNIIRPLIYSSKEEIVCALDSAEVNYVIDSTNYDVEYTRNYIRNEITPLLKKINATPEKMFTRLSTNLRDDIRFINSALDDFISKNYHDESIALDALLSADKAIVSRFLVKILRQKTSKVPERTHIDSIYSHLNHGDFSYSLPGGLKFESRNGRCFITENVTAVTPTFFKALSLGVNVIDGFSTVIIIDANISDCYSNIYKISIQQKIPCDIINNGLHVREKQDGDSYRYGGMTRRLKKIFNDRKIEACDRSRVPVICDSEGILWVPGLPLRDGISQPRELYIAIAEPIQDTDSLSDTTTFTFKTL
ncbi:MAG: tRNA lysidine(34) synthetase TilS [Clostridia bacterium]|nr:tRNA lysidine(34) synthetase TilS [Clostridia bacterium]